MIYTIKHEDQKTIVDILKSFSDWNSELISQNYYCAWKFVGGDLKVLVLDTKVEVAIPEIFALKRVFLNDQMRVDDIIVEIFKLKKVKSENRVLFGNHYFKEITLEVECIKTYKDWEEYSLDVLTHYENTPLKLEVALVKALLSKHKIISGNSFDPLKSDIFTKLNENIPLLVSRSKDRL